MPPGWKRYDCVDCKVGSAEAPNERIAICDRCRLQRRREGRNRVEVHCKECAKAMYPEARQVGTWDGLCPPCRQEKKRAEDSPNWPEFNLEPLPRGLREVTTSLNPFDYWQPVNVLEDIDLTSPTAYEATRVFKLNGREIKAGEVVLISDRLAIVGRWKTKAQTLNGAVKLGWLVETTKLAPSRFQRNDVI